MFEVLASAFWVGLFSFLLALVAVALEWLSPSTRVPAHSRWAGAVMVFVGPSLGILVAVPLNRLWQWIDGAGRFQLPLDLWLSPLGWGAGPVKVVVLLLLIDFLRYWRHRAEHRWFWRIHAVHHSPQELHATHNLAHPLQVIPEMLFVAIPLSMVQMNYVEPAIIGGLVGFMTFYIHSPIELHLGALRRVIVDNRFHRIHHSVEERHFDKNFGIAFSLWDALFGTAHWPKQGEWPAVGVEGVAPPRSVSEFLLHPFQQPGREDSAKVEARTL